jgi:hypothetical protein
MPPPPPSRPGPTREALEHQDQSIKARKSELFDARHAEPGRVVRPFAEYLRETPATPLSPGWKAGLWALGALVALLLVASLAKSVGGRSSAGRPPAAGVSK